MDCSGPETLTAIVNAIESRLLPIFSRFERRLDGAVSQEYFSIRQAAVYTGLSGKSIRRAVRKGMLPCSNPMGGKRATLCIARKDLDTLMLNTRLKQGPARVERDVLVGEVFGRKRRSQEVA